MKYAAASGIAFGLTMYSYILAIMMLPVFAVLAVIYSFVLKKINIRQIGTSNFPHRNIPKSLIIS